MSSRIVAIIQARLGSARLPAKALRSLAGRPMISHVVERVRAVRGLSDILLATSMNEQDGALETFSRRLSLKVWRGSEWDVLGRLRDAAAWADADVIMRVTGDCPLFAPDVAEAALSRYNNSHATNIYTWNDTAASGYPDGTDVEIFSRGLLESANAHAVGRLDREHVTPWIRRNFPVETLRSDIDYSAFKLSVDRLADLEFVEAITARLAVPFDLTLAATMAAARSVVQEAREP